MDVKPAWLLLIAGFLGGTTCGILIENQLLHATRAAGSAEVASDVAAVSAPASQPAAAKPVPTTVVARKPVSAQPSETGNDPGLARISVNDATYQFGDRESGDVIDHVFMIANHGQSTLKIAKVMAACGCTVPKLAKSELAPGEQTELKVQLNLSRQKGPQNREIVVQSNDPTKPALTVAMVGNAVPRVGLIPERVELRDVPQESPPDSVVKVVAKEGLHFNVLSTRTSGEAVEANVTVIKPGEEFDVAIKLKPPLPAGPFKGWVHLLTDHKGEYRVVGIPVLLDVRDDGIAVAASEGTEDQPHAPAKRPPAVLIKEGDHLDFSGPRLDGQIIDDSQFRGTPVVVAFWASWCGVCKREMPTLKAIYDEFGPKGLKVVGISLDRKREALEQYVQTNQISWPNIYFDEGSDGKAVNPLARKYNVSGVPRFVVLDRDGKVLLANGRGEQLRTAVAAIIENNATGEPKDQPAVAGSGGQ